MNGKDINSMAQQYKDEMMRLYRKSSANSGMTAPQQDTNMMRPPAHEHHHHNGMSNTPVELPVNCSCRFPSAEAIINGIAGTPMPLPITPEDNPPPVYTPPEATTYPMPRERSTSMSQAAAESIMINAVPRNVNYDVPSETENEQELLPDFPLPADIPPESVETVPQTADLAPSMSWISLTGDDSWGYLQAEVFTADGALPVPGALITVRKKLPGGSGLVRILFTNRSGKTPTIALPAPGQRYSQYPGSTVRPYSEYSITVRAKGYYTIRDINIPIFAGIKSVQPIDLIPAAQFDRPQPRNESDMG